MQILNCAGENFGRACAVLIDDDHQGYFPNPFGMGGKGVVFLGVAAVSGDDHSMVDEAIYRLD